MHCAECLVQNCQVQCKQPGGADCPMKDQALFDAILAEYQKPDIHTFYEASVESMRQSFARLTRLMETINFCRLMKYHTSGIAYCSGMLREGRIVNALFKKEGFETVSAGCKVGGFSSEELIGPCPMRESLPERRDLRSLDGRLHPPEKVKPRAICDPIGQAMVLNEANTEFNVVIGLCVGHDSLFLQYANAPCTVLVAKDRMLNHNPVADLYTAEARGLL